MNHGFLLISTPITNGSNSDPPPLRNHPCESLIYAGIFTSIFPSTNTRIATLNREMTSIGSSPIDGIMVMVLYDSGHWEV